MKPVTLHKSSPVTAEAKVHSCYSHSLMHESVIYGLFAACACEKVAAEHTTSSGLAATGEHACNVAESAGSEAPACPASVIQPVLRSAPCCWLAGIRTLAE